MRTIIDRAQRIIDLAKANAPTVILKNEGRILTGLLDKLPTPKRLPTRRRKENWSPL